MCAEFTLAVRGALNVARPWFIRSRVRCANLKSAVGRETKMRFADYGWKNCEPSIPQVVAAAYLEARGFEFGTHFSVETVVELAENLYAAEMELEKEQKR